MAEYTSFFRCMVCAKAVEMNEWLKKERVKCSCGSGRWMPTVLRPFEVFKYLITHPSVAYETVKAKFMGDRNG